MANQHGRCNAVSVGGAGGWGVRLSLKVGCRLHLNAHCVAATPAPAFCHPSSQHGTLCACCWTCVGSQCSQYLPLLPILLDPAGNRPPRTMLADASGPLSMNQCSHCMPRGRELGPSVAGGSWCPRRLCTCCWQISPRTNPPHYPSVDSSHRHSGVFFSACLVPRSSCTVLRPRLREHSPHSAPEFCTCKAFCPLNLTTKRSSKARVRPRHGQPPPQTAAPAPRSWPRRRARDAP